MPVIKDILVKDVVTINPEDKISLAIGKMDKYKIHQLPVTDNGKVLGMLFLRDIITKNINPELTKVKSLVVHTPSVDVNATHMDAARLILNNGIRALPVVDNEKLVGIIAETDLMKFVDGRAVAHDLMTSPICINEHDNIGKAKQLIRDKNISRLPIVNRECELVGVINTLDLIKVMKPKQKQTKAFDSVTEKLPTSDISVQVILRKPETTDKDTRIDKLINILKEHDEVIVTEDKKPVGIITPKDIIELLIKFEKPSDSINWQITNLGEEDEITKDKIVSLVERFLSKQRKIGDVEYLFFYVDKYKKQGRVKYSIRARFKLPFCLFVARSHSWDLLACFNKVIEKLKREITKKHNKIIEIKRRQNLKNRW